MIEVIERVDHKYEDQEAGETFTLAWRHIKLVGAPIDRAQVIKELFMPPDSKVRLFPQEVLDGYNHFVVSGWWGR
jgi:hypothetical protein